MRHPRRSVVLLLLLAVLAPLAVVIPGPAGATGPSPATTPAAPDPGDRATAPSSLAVGDVTSYGLGVRDPFSLTVGPDGNLWFTSLGNDAIGRMTPAGVVEMFTDPLVQDPRGITAGPDGNVWFTSRGNDQIGRITPAGALTFFTSADVLAPRGIVTGPDGNLWFTNEGASTVGQITPAGVITPFEDLSLLSTHEIAAGPDGNLWVTSGVGGVITRLTTAGAFTAFVDADLGTLRNLTAGPDGNVWFTNAEGKVGSVTPAGVVTAYGDASIADPRWITAGPDGALWFADNGNDTIGRVTTGGALSVVTDPSMHGVWGVAGGPGGKVWFTNRTADTIGAIDPATSAVEAFTGSGVAGPDGIVGGPDGNVWFANFAGGSVGRVTPSGDITLFPTGGTPTGIALGTDGDLWFTSFLSNAIGRITTAGVVTLYTDPTIAAPLGIAPGPDGAMWFTNFAGGSLGRITAAGAVTRFQPTGIDRPVDLTTGPDGNVWFTDRARNTIGRLDPTTGALATFTSPKVARPGAIAAARDGNLWFVNEDGPSIGRISLGGSITVLEDASVLHPADITVGPDDALWFTDADRDAPAVGRIDTDLSIDRYTGPGVGQPRQLAAGPDGAVWFTDSNSSIGTVGAGPAPAGLTFHPLAPERVLDSRSPLGGWSGPLAAGVPRTLHLTGSHGVPSGARAVVMNVAVTQGSAASYLTVYPAGGSVPNAANLNFAAGQTIPNLVTVKLSDLGDVAFANGSGSVDVVVDLVGYYEDAPGDRMNAIVPTRILDSRTPTGGWSGPLAAGTPETLAVTGVAGVPATATAVVLNATVTDATANSYLTLYPSGTATPTAANLNFAAGQTTGNAAVVKVGTGGGIDIANAIGSVDVVVDVVGYFDPASGDLFHPLFPTRVLDSRGVNGGWNGPLPAATPRLLGVAGVRGVPTSASAVVGNTAVTNGTADSYLLAYPGGASPPLVANLNFAAGQTLSNLVTVKLGTQGDVALRNAQGSVHVIVDLVGYFAAV